MSLVEAQGWATLQMLLAGSRVVSGASAGILLSNPLFILIFPLNILDDEVQLVRHDVVLPNEDLHGVIKLVDPKNDLTP